MAWHFRDFRGDQRVATTNSENTDMPTFWASPWSEAFIFSLFSPFSLYPLVRFGQDSSSSMGQQSLIYSFVARGTVILAEYTEFTGNFTSIATQCLQKLPATNNKFTYNCDGHTFNYLVDNGFSNFSVSSYFLLSISSFFLRFSWLSSFDCLFFMRFVWFSCLVLTRFNGDICVRCASFLLNALPLLISEWK